MTKARTHGNRTFYNLPYQAYRPAGDNNGWISEIFDLERGVRQGCPLSALLFILSVEALACRIRQNNEIKGFKYGTLAVQAVKICQYVDDTILFLKKQGPNTNCFKRTGQF